MRSVVTTAKTREEAIEAALRQLGVERHEVAVEILDEGSRGFLGIGSRDVEIRVTAEHLPDEEPETKPVQTESRGRGSRRDEGKERRERRTRNEKGSGESDSRSAQTEQRSRQSNNRNQQRSRRSDKKEGDGTQERQKNDRKQSDRRPQQARNQDRDSTKTTPVGDEETQRENGAPRSDEKSQSRKPPSPLTPGEVTATSALLDDMIRLMGIEATVVSRTSDNGETVLSVESPDSAILIGRKGRNLQAVQYLINRMVRNGENQPEADRIVVDIEGYLERRKASLEEMAQRLAQKAKESGRRIRVKPMSPQERRVIHMTLQDDPDVRTFSVGDTQVKCLIIAPKDEKQPPKRRSGGGRRGGRGRSNPRSSETADVSSTQSADDGVGT